MSKYENFTDFLRSNDEDQITIKITYLNELVKRIDPKGLPQSAYNDNWKTWWSNNKSSTSRQCDAWLKVGWKTDLTKSKQGEYITFIKDE
ncbi:MULTISPECIES: hypothetical protein [unclassified Paenibacillus]|uniref:DUF7662 domain-containing protein n=1 Tax=unclassified Paenibacillus TaxID=185978 RepID=UPI00055F90D9|nr:MULTISPECIES: hypothetical protein [unclassified Paenibacillus]